MKLSKLRDDRDYYTSKLSEIVRQLDFAGIAIIWIFRTGAGTGGITFSRFLLWPMGCLVLSLAFDLLHYAWGSAVWDIITVATIRRELIQTQRCAFRGM